MPEAQSVHPDAFDGPCRLTPRIHLRKTAKRCFLELDHAESPRYRPASAETANRQPHSDSPDASSIRPITATHHGVTVSATYFEIANCWVHARRYYIKAEPDFPQADEMLKLIAKLCRVVGGAESHGIRGPVRKRWVQCLLDAMKTWMLEARPAPGSSLERAICKTTGEG